MNRELGETIAAFSQGFFTHTLYQGTYGDIGEHVGGFPAFWGFAVDAAEAFEDEAKGQKVVWGETHEYPQAIDVYVEEVYQRMHETYFPTAQELKAAAKRAIDSAK